MSNNLSHSAFLQEFFVPSGFVTVRLTFSWLKWKRNKLSTCCTTAVRINLSFVLKQFCFPSRLISCPCAPLFYVPTQRRPSNDLCYVKGVVHMCRNRRTKNLVRLLHHKLLNADLCVQHMFTESAFIPACR